jgi:hypothetical protein
MYNIKNLIYLKQQPRIPEVQEFVEEAIFHFAVPPPSCTFFIDGFIIIMFSNEKG